MEPKPATNRYGLSRKTNVALAAIAGITTANQSWEAIMAITLIGCYAITLQFIIDREQPEERIL
jgi:hypothetical protein